MMLKPASGFVLALTVAVGMVVTTFPRDEPLAAESAVPASSSCEADKQKLLMSRARSGLPGDATPALFSEEPVGLLGYCSYDCSGCSTTAECRARGAGSCYNICP